MPGMPVCWRSGSRYASSTGSEPPGEKIDGCCCADGRLPATSASAAAVATPSRIRNWRSIFNSGLPYERKLREAHRVVAPERPDERAVARRGIGTDANVVVGVGFERRAAEQRLPREVGERTPRHFFFRRGVGEFGAAV